MAAQLTSTTAAAFLQRFYSPGFIANSIAAKASKLLGRMKRNPDCGGDSYNFLTVVDEIATGSAIFSIAQGIAANSTNTIGGQFTCAYLESNEPARITGLLVAQTKHKTAAWTAALKFAMDSALRMAAHRLSIRVYTQGWGELGIVKAASVSGATFKLATDGHVYRVVKGMEIVGSSSLNAATLRSATALTVSAVNYSTGLITLDGNLATPGIVAGDTVFCEGDRESASSPTRRCPTGLEAWIPYQPVTDSTISTLHGVVRSSNSLYYGHYVDGRNQSVVDSLTQLAQSLSSIGNAEKVVGVVSPNNFQTISRALGDARRYVDIPGSGAYAGFKTIAIMVDGLEVPLMSDKYLGDDRIYMGDPSVFELNSLGAAPHIDTEDGNKILRIGDDNGYEVRIVSYTCMAMKDPTKWGVIQVTDFT